MDNSNNANILRYPVGAETWQARHDVTIGDTTYEGWITDEGSTEVATGKNAGMEYIRIKNFPDGLSTLSTGYGYLKKYQVREITKGQEKMDVLFFTMKYFLYNDQILTIDFRADNTLVGRTGFDASKSLGQLFSIDVLMPTNGRSFSEEFMNSVVEAYKFNTLQQEFYGTGDWIKPNDLRNLLIYPQTDHLDLTGRFVVSLF